MLGAYYYLLKHLTRLFSFFDACSCVNLLLLGRWVFFWGSFFQRSCTWCFFLRCACLGCSFLESPMPQMLLPILSILLRAPSHADSRLPCVEICALLPLH